MSKFVSHFFRDCKFFGTFLLLFCSIFLIRQTMAQETQVAPPIQATTVVPEQKSTQVEANDVEAEVKVFNEKVLRFNLLFINTVASTLTIYASPAGATNWGDQVNSVKSQSDAKLQAEALRSLIPVFSSEFQKLASDPELTLRTQQLSSEGVKQLRASTGSFLILMLQSRGILESGRKIINSTNTKPENLALILPIKESLPLLAMSVTSLSTALPKISNALKPPVNSSQGKTKPN